VPGGNAGDKTVGAGNGLARIVRTEDKEVAVGDVVEGADAEGEALDVPEGGTLRFNLLYLILLWRHRVTVCGTADILMRLHGLILSTMTVWSDPRRMPAP